MDNMGSKTSKNNTTDTTATNVIENTNYLDNFKLAFLKDKLNAAKYLYNNSSKDEKEKINLFLISDEISLEQFKRIYHYILKNDRIIIIKLLTQETKIDVNKLDFAIIEKNSYCL